jgi:hypothetical protein
MRGRTKRLTIATVLTIAGVAAAKDCCGEIGQAFSQGLLVRAALLGFLCLWVASAAVCWLHAACDLRQTFRERRGRLKFNAAISPAEPGRDSNV